MKWKSLSRVRLFRTPWTVACQAPLSMEFSRQEYWSGLPFPSLGDLPNLGIKPGSSALQADSLSSEPPGKSKNVGVGSLSLLQGIFPTQGSNRGLLHCRWILYQLSYQESPQWVKEWSKTADLEKPSLVPEESKETRQQLKRESGIMVEVWAYL